MNKNGQFYFIASFFLVVAIASYFFMATNRVSKQASNENFNSNCVQLYNELSNVVDCASYNNLSMSKTTDLVNKTIYDYSTLFPKGNADIFVYIQKNQSLFFSNFNAHIVLSNGVSNKSKLFFGFYNSSSSREAYLLFNGFSYNFSNVFYNDSIVSLINVFIYLNNSGRVDVCYYSPEFNFH